LKNAIACSPGQEDRQIGVQLWGKGAYEREPLDGGKTKYKMLSRVEKDDIIVNKIWARNGSVAVVTELQGGCYASNKFPTFRPITDKSDPCWLHWYTKTSSFWQQCDEKSRGTSGKNRIRPERFLEIEIPSETATELTALLPSILSKAFRGEL
jgi:type I restriction enzyme S subunit